MMGMRLKKVLAVAVMLAALAAILAGTSYVNNYSSQVTRRNPISTESIIIPINGYGQLTLAPNETQENYYFSISISKGTVRESCVSNELYDAWLNGTYRLSWREEPTPRADGAPNTAENYYPVNVVTQETHYIFWNPDSPVSKEVTLTICRQWTETVRDNFKLGFGFFLIVAGSVSGLGGAFWVSKRALLVVIALVSIASGVFCASMYSQMYHGEQVVTTYFVVVPANGWIDEPAVYDQPGYYAFIVIAKNGTINSAVLSQSDFEAFSQNQYEPNWLIVKGSQDLGGTMTGGSPNKNYLVLSNSDALDKPVNIEVYRTWDSYNVSGLAGCILLVAAGIVVFYIANRSHLAAFNKALENQE